MTRIEVVAAKWICNVTLLICRVGKVVIHTGKNVTGYYLIREVYIPKFLH